MLPLPVRLVLSVILPSAATASLAAKTGITNNVPDNSVMGGFPAMPMKEWLRQEANLRKVGDMLKRVKALEKELAELKK